MLVSGIASRPQYKPLELDPTGHRHLIVADHVGILQNAKSLIADGVSAELWSVTKISATDTALHADGDGVSQRSFRSIPQLFEHLTRQLAQEQIGFRLYAVGTEPFIWDVAKLARERGMDQGEFHLTHEGSERRRVHCIHCRAMTEDVTTNIVACRGCGAHLLVRDHFSRRLSAFMGVMVDAEVPGEIPAIEETFA